MPHFVRRAHAVLALAIGVSGGVSTDGRPPALAAASAARDVLLARETEIVEFKVPRNSTLPALLLAHHLPLDLTAAIVKAVSSVFDVRAFKAEQSFRLRQSAAGSFRGFEYDVDPDRYLSVTLHDRGPNGEPTLDVFVAPYPKTVAPHAVRATITRERSSLVASLDAEGESIDLALRLAAIMGGEIDFNSELQRGDRLETLVDRVSRDGKPIGYGMVQAAVLQSSARRVVAVEFPDAEGRPAWFDEQGRSLKRQFLHSPLPFEPRVTSGFSFHRINPVSGDLRAHLGVDYGAPVGTPVVAVAAGTVVSAGWSGDAGRLVVLRHAGGYETLYLHLSAFAPGLRAGMHVDQGTLIGRVGQSGAATGPHLDYRIRKNGTYVNPSLEISRMPKGDPIAPGAMPAFEAARDRALQQLAQALASHER